MERLQGWVHVPMLSGEISSAYETINLQELAKDPSDEKHVSGEKAGVVSLL